MAVFNNQPTKFLKMEQQALRSQYKLAPVFQCILRGKKKERQKGETPSGLISQAGRPHPQRSCFSGLFSRMFDFYFWLGLLAYGILVP